MRKSTNKANKKAAKKTKKKSAPKAAAAPRVSTASKVVDLRLLEEVNEFMCEQDLVELKWEAKGVNLHLRRRETPLAPLQPAAPAPTAQQPIAKEPVAVAAAPKVDTRPISSPFVGTFYKSPSPNEKSFVEVGQVVKPGDVLCIIEAMKLMNEIESDLKGRVVKTLIDDGTPVEYGEALFEIEPL